MYTIIITDIITKETVEVCNYDCLEAVEISMTNMASILPHYLEVDFREAVLHG